MKSKVAKWTLAPLLLGGMALLLLICDIVLKAYASGFLDLPITLLSMPFGIEFSLERVLNQGAMWGIFSEYSNILFCFRVGVVIALLVVLFFFTKRKVSALFLTFIITGAIGNVADTLAYGYVVDMLHFTFSGRSFGIFNLADSYIFIGCIGLITLSFMKSEKKSDNHSL